MKKIRTMLFSSLLFCACAHTAPSVGTTPSVLAPPTQEELRETIIRATTATKTACNNPGDRFLEMDEARDGKVLCLVSMVVSCRERFKIEMGMATTMANRLQEACSRGASGVGCDDHPGNRYVVVDDKTLNRACVEVR